MSIAASLKASGVAEVIVVLRSGQEASTAALDTGAAAVLRHFKTSPYSQDAALLEVLQARALDGSEDFHGALPSATRLSVTSSYAGPRHYPNLGLVLGNVDRAGLSELRKERNVDQIVPAPQLRLIRPVAKAATESQPGYSWGLRSLQIDHLHTDGLTGKDVLIGHLDTGVDASHPALEGAVQFFAEFDSMGNYVDGSPPRDSAEHGTHTAGTLAGREVNGIRFGVAPGAKLASAMVIEGGQQLARILGGMDWIVGQGARVLSMSLGLVGVDETLRAISRILRARGVLPVFAIGNDAPGRSRYPGNYAEVLSVGAADSLGRVADFSSSQLFKRTQDPIVPDLVGPGVDVLSCVPGGYVQMSGTSMATPHIAGLAALLMEARPDKTIDEVETAIFRSCSLLPGMLVNRANRGFPNAVRALNLL
jgi:subtilisin